MHIEPFAMKSLPRVLITHDICPEYSSCLLRVGIQVGCGGLTHSLELGHLCCVCERFVRGASKKVKKVNENGRALAILVSIIMLLS
jgi:hypothetical protein